MELNSMLFSCTVLDMLLCEIKKKATKKNQNYMSNVSCYRFMTLFLLDGASISALILIFYVFSHVNLIFLNFLYFREPHVQINKIKQQAIKFHSNVQLILKNRTCYRFCVKQANYALPDTGYYTKMHCVSTFSIIHRNLPGESCYALYKHCQSKSPTHWPQHTLSNMKFGTHCIHYPFGLWTW